MFENRKHTMFKRWDRMAKAFTRVGKEISIAVKGGGPNPDHNPSLRRAMQNARACNMPKDKVQNAIDKASGVGATDYAELIYEGFGPHGVALVVETATDNPTRTVANVRLAFKKGNGSLGASGSVLFMFDRQGVFRLKAEGLDLEEFELDLMDHGLEEMEQVQDKEGEPLIEVRCGFNDFGAMQAAIEARGIDTLSSESEYLPQNTVELSDEQLEEVLALVDRVEQDDDVQRVFHNLA
jgi:YebC/PmpR family DNA-binding regulatory protein